MTITLRATKGSRLTHAELDANFTDLQDSANLDFIASGTGAVATDLQARGRLEVNLWDALSTAERADIGTASLDVSAAVATAIGWFGANGGTLVIPGYFGLGATGIAIASKTGIVIEGRGPKAGFKSLAVSATVVAASGVSMIRITSSTRCGLRNLYIDNDSKAHNAIAGSANTECFIEGNHIVNGGLNASVFFVGGTGNAFLKNTIKDSAANSRGMWIGNVNASESETEARVIANYMNNIGASGIGGVFVRSTIADNVCVDTDGSGIVVSSDISVVYSFDVSITGNICKGNAFQGIQVGDPTAAGDYVEAISVSGNVCSGNTQAGIGCFEARNSTISGNSCKDNGIDGISVTTGKRLSIVGNNCYDSRSAGSRTQDVGIRLTAQVAASDVEDIQISGNVCYNHVLHGIQVTNSGSGTIDTVAIVGNSCLDNTTSGISVTDVADGNVAPVIIVGNTCLGSGTSDIRADPTDATLSGNKFSSQSGVIPTFTDQDTTPSVSGRLTWRCNNTAGTAITNFDDGIEGQEITIIFADANTTIADAGNFRLSAAYASTADDVLKLVLRSSVWYEVSRSAN